MLATAFKNMSIDSKESIVDVHGKAREFKAEFGEGEEKLVKGGRHGAKRSDDRDSGNVAENDLVQEEYLFLERKEPEEEEKEGNLFRVTNKDKANIKVTKFVEERERKDKKRHRDKHRKSRSKSRSPESRASSRKHRSNRSKSRSPSYNPSSSRSRSNDNSTKGGKHTSGKNQDNKPSSKVLKDEAAASQEKSLESFLKVGKPKGKTVGDHKRKF